MRKERVMEMFVLVGLVGGLVLISRTWAENSGGIPQGQSSQIMGDAVPPGVAERQAADANETVSRAQAVEEAKKSSNKKPSASDATKKEKVNENQKVNEKQKVDEKKSLEELRKKLREKLIDLTEEQREIMKRRIKSYRQDRDSVNRPRNSAPNSEVARRGYVDDLETEYRLENELRQYTGKQLSREEALKERKKLLLEIEKTLGVGGGDATRMKELEARKELKKIDFELEKIKREKESKSNKPPK